MPSSSIHVERRSKGKRLNAAVPLIFSRFNTRQLYTQHQGMTRNHSPFGACIQGSQQYAPGTILFIRKDSGSGNIEIAPTDQRDLARNTTLAEVRWCVPNEQAKPDGKYTIGVRYL